MPSSTAVIERPGLPSRSPRHPILRDGAFALVSVAGVVLAYLTTSDSPAISAAVVLALATASGMHARLAMGRVKAAALVVTTAALLSLAGASPRLVGVVLISALSATALVARSVRRATVLQAGAWTSVIAGAASLSGLVSAVPLPAGAALREALGALVGGFLGAPVLLTAGPAMEWLFGHRTRLTMGEWLSYEHPLLRQLAATAPGTFQHAINVGVLADAGARAIGADALLARVGGLFHDVGKLNAPEYFVENQNGPNPHDALDPRESAAILKAHVLDGVELVAAHHMGDRIVDFVREHHGTGAMRVFREKAAALGRAAEVEGDTYRYPGPRPRSRETAVVMIVDQLEATARAAPPADEEGADDLVRATIERIRDEGELADSGLTGAEIDRLRPGLSRAVSAMYHRRLSYPPAGGSPPPRPRLALLPRLFARRGVPRV